MGLSTGARLGPYEIVGQIGAGGMGEVYRAHDTRLDRDVAIKLLSSHLAASPEVLGRFEREARAISHLNHPHICTLHDIGHQEGIDYLVMELLEGETLAQRLEKGPLPIADLLKLGTQIADALDAAHRSGVVHRDLKPANIMLTKGGAKLMDVGLARATETTPAAVFFCSSSSSTLVAGRFLLGRSSPGRMPRTGGMFGMGGNEMSGMASTLHELELLLDKGCTKLLDKCKKGVLLHGRAVQGVRHGLASTGAHVEADLVGQLGELADRPAFREFGGNSVREVVVTDGRDEGQGELPLFRHQLTDGAVVEAKPRFLHIEGRHVVGVYRLDDEGVLVRHLVVDHEFADVVKKPGGGRLVLSDTLDLYWNVELGEEIR